MANPQFAHEADKELSRQNDLKQAYRDWQDSFVARDLIKYLTESRDISQNIAGGEMDNMGKKALYLQDAHAYGKVLSYISDMLD